ncbi:quinone-dependent dihydroorotate dehydrogenase [Chondromyces apiculatus]|uniref:Dihydroorotate dehydrogenase (quinone) n=1 Tax=Chondromyces apiculatus DSM 436 TaxID=1192034 RepID=A0A017T8J6_9BACT|nr:quinone-dependent dihydroorotate dehydrogenase [Chondromyces apiculatus]EYF05307.1 Dihydroorotate dehydrogenase [Chondromyces apiculatus DSM 436]
MYRLIRPLLFALPAHTAHTLGMLALAPLEHVAPLRALVRSSTAPDPLLRTRVMGLDFPSPLGIAGGFDKNAQRARAIAALGFGFLELGTVTALAQAENPRPNLFRLPADRALVNRLGFPNQGAARISTRIRARDVARHAGIPVGISIGKSRAVPLDPIEPAIADYLTSLRAARDAADFVVVNVSSPNTQGLRALQGAAVARALLGALADDNRAHGAALPLLVKVAPDLDDEDFDALLDVVDEVGLAGIVATNTTVRRDGLTTPPDVVQSLGAGGLSGPPLRARALAMVRRARARLGANATLIGVGGVETADHALDLIRAGADLVQLYTAFIYGGPSLPARIARDLSARVAESGARSITDLRG